MSGLAWQLYRVINGCRKYLVSKSVPVCIQYCLQPVMLLLLHSNIYLSPMSNGVAPLKRYPLVAPCTKCWHSERRLRLEFTSSSYRCALECCLCCFSSISVGLLEADSQLWDSVLYSFIEFVIWIHRCGCLYCDFCYLVQLLWLLMISLFRLMMLDFWIRLLLGSDAVLQSFSSVFFVFTENRVPKITC